MKFRIDSEKLRNAVKKKRGINSYSYTAKKIGIHEVSLQNIEKTDSKLLPLITYAAVCAWLGVSLYHFLIESE